MFVYERLYYPRSNETYYLIVELIDPKYYKNNKIFEYDNDIDRPASNSYDEVKQLSQRVISGTISQIKYSSSQWELVHSNDSVTFDDDLNKKPYSIDVALRRAAHIEYKVIRGKNCSLDEPTKILPVKIFMLFSASGNQILPYPDVKSQQYKDAVNRIYNKFIKYNEYDLITTVALSFIPGLSYIYLFRDAAIPKALKQFVIFILSVSLMLAFHPAIALVTAYIGYIAYDSLNKAKEMNEYWNNI
jgi:hypothetical protein